MTSLARGNLIARTQSSPTYAPLAPVGHRSNMRERCNRPAQDCSLCYGGAVSISRIDELTPNTFTETVVRTVKADPSWPYPHGVHTLSAAGDVTYLDAKRRVFNRHETLAELTARVRKLRPGRA